MNLWRLYSYFYDNLNKLIPYRNMLDEVCNKITQKSGCVVLDAGCGTGNLCELVSRNSEIKVVGIDNSDSMLKMASNKVKERKNVILEKQSLNEPLKFQNQTFDCVVLSNVLYATNNPIATLGEIHRIMNLEGVLIIVNPLPGINPNTPFYEHCKINKNDILGNIILTFNMLMIGLINFIIKVKGRKNTYHFLNAEELSRILQNIGFKEFSFKKTYADEYIFFTANK